MLADETRVYDLPKRLRCLCDTESRQWTLKERLPMQKMILCEGCQEPILLFGIGSGEERMQDVTCERCGMLLEVSWPINGFPEVRAEPKPQ